MRKRKADILFWILVAFLLLHLLFYPLPLIKDQPLAGFFRLPLKVEFSLKNYFSRSFQDSTEKYINYKMGLNPGFTRIHHQMEYSLFNRLHAYDVHAGKDNYLFRYCKGCITEGTFAPPVLERFMQRYLAFADSLEKAGKKVVWVIAPDKNFVFSEKLSPELHQPDEICGFYWSLKKAFKENKISFLDFNELAFREKNKYQYPVFTKGGVHWSQAYAARCFDSLCNYLSARSDIQIRNTIKYNRQQKPWNPDIDMEIASNLLARIPEDDFYLAEMTSKVAKKKKLLLIGDSFTYAWTWPGDMARCFDPASEFWYYNRERNLLSGNKTTGNVDHANARKEIASFDTFIFVFTALNAENLDYGFMDDLYSGR
jgi:hypothetical protein